MLPYIFINTPTPDKQDTGNIFICPIIEWFAIRRYDDDTILTQSDSIL